MAKSRKATKEFTFEDLNKELSEVAPLGSTMDISTFSEITEHINIGSHVLNLCMTGSVFGGIPNNRAVELMGPSGVGKTFVMLSALRNAQSMGYYCYWYDSENAVDKKLMENFGIDTSKVWYEPCNTVESFRTSVTNLTGKLINAKRNGMEIPKVMVFLDSIGNLGTLKELNDAESGSTKEDMTRAKRIKSLFRILMTRMAEVKIPFIYSNHVYKTTDFMAAWVGSGGCLTPGHKVLVDKKTMSYINIEDLKEGDFVETLNGKKEVKDTFEFNKKIIEVEFEDGTIIKCSEEHRFYIGGDIHDNSSWIKAKDLVKGSTILTV